MHLPIRLTHFTSHTCVVGRSEEAAVAGACDHRDLCVAFKSFKAFGEQLGRAFQIKRVERSHGDVQLTGQERSQSLPIALEYKADVVLLPSFGYGGIDLARFAIPKALWQADLRRAARRPLRTSAIGRRAR